MKKKSLILLSVCCIAIAAFFFFQDTDKRQIIKRLDTIVQAVAKPKGEGNIAMAAKHQSLLNILTDNVTIYCADPPLEETFTATEIMSHYVTLRRYCDSLELDVSDIDVTITDDTHAQLFCYGKAKIHTTTNRDYDEARPVILTFVKQDGKWLLSAAREHTTIH